MPKRLRKNLSGATSSLDIYFSACESTLSKRALAKKVAAGIAVEGIKRRTIACAAGGRGDPCTQ
jgi:hypothetical protein